MIKTSDQDRPYSWRWLTDSGDLTPSQLQSFITGQNTSQRKLWLTVLEATVKRKNNHVNAVYKKDLSLLSISPIFNSLVLFHLFTPCQSCQQYRYFNIYRWGSPLPRICLVQFHLRIMLLCLPAITSFMAKAEMCLFKYLHFTYFLFPYSFSLIHTMSIWSIIRIS